MKESSEKLSPDEKNPELEFSTMTQVEDSQALDTPWPTAKQTLPAEDMEAELPARAPIQEPAAKRQLAPLPEQETDAWWGSYSGWTMLPSMALCIGLSGLIGWGSWELLDRGLVQLSILTLTAAVWLTQVIRWSYRVFGYTYRLTTRRLFQEKGWFLDDRNEVELAKVAKVYWRRSFHHVLTRIGTVGVLLEGPGNGGIVLEGVWQPRQVADLIQQLSESARERQVVLASGAA
jgi:hypothetical protein